MLILKYRQSCNALVRVDKLTHIIQFVCMVWYVLGPTIYKRIHLSVSNHSLSVMKREFWQGVVKSNKGQRSI